MFTNITMRFHFKSKMKINERNRKTQFPEREKEFHEFKYQMLKTF